MKREIKTVLPVQDAVHILVDAILAARQIETVPNSPRTATLLIVFAPDKVTGEPVPSQFRIDVTVDEAREAWRGED